LRDRARCAVGASGAELAIEAGKRNATLAILPVNPVLRDLPYVPEIRQVPEIPVTINRQAGENPDEPFGAFARGEVQS
jgi:hypothetical protein